MNKPIECPFCARIGSGLVELVRGQAAAFEDGDDDEDAGTVSAADLTIVTGQLGISWRF